MAITDETTTRADQTPSATQKIAFCVPVLPGMEEQHRRDMASAERGEMRDQHSASRRRAGITAEKAWHQETPDGTIGIVYIEADDVPAAFEAMATSDDPYDVGFREHVTRINGIDLTEEFPPPDLLIDWVSPTVGSAATQTLGYAAPILPGKAAVDRAYYASVTSDRSAEFAASRAAAGITREVAFHQDTPMGVVAVGIMEAEDLDAALEHLATSDAPADRYFRENVREVHGIDFEDGFPAPEQILDWS